MSPLLAVPPWASVSPQEAQKTTPLRLAVYHY